MLIIVGVILFLILAVALLITFTVRSSLALQNHIIWPRSVNCGIGSADEDTRGYAENLNSKSNLHVMYFHGNTETCHQSLSRLSSLSEIASLYCLEYPCYSNECPVDNLHPETFWTHINETVLKLVLKIHEYPNQRIVFYGRSIGTGVVCHLLNSKLNEYMKTVILETPFTSIADILTDMVGDTLSGMLTDKLHWTMENKNHISNAYLDDKRFLVIAGKRDKLTPLSHAKKINQILQKSAKSSSLIVFEKGHIIPFSTIKNDIFSFLQMII